MSKLGADKNAGRGGAKLRLGRRRRSAADLQLDYSARRSQSLRPSYVERPAFQIAVSYNVDLIGSAGWADYGSDLKNQAADDIWQTHGRIPNRGSQVGAGRLALPVRLR